VLVEATIQHSQTSSYKYLKIITGFFFANDYLNKNTSIRPSIKKNIDSISSLFIAYFLA
jgi:hypothetical protein